MVSEMCVVKEVGLMFACVVDVCMVFFWKHFVAYNVSRRKVDWSSVIARQFISMFVFKQKINDH